MSRISSSSTKKPFFQEIFSWLYSFWKFSRPHTIIGTTLSVIALYAIALTTVDRNLNSSIEIGQLFGTWLACLCGNIYITGLNQLEDVAIDKINKPHLPIAAGEFSLQTGKYIVAICGIVALFSSGFLGVWLFATVGLSLAIGTIYSLPPIRLKRFPFFAALCIFLVRGIVVNLGIFSHFIERFQGKVFLTPAVLLITAFILIFTVAIAIFKDIPDLEGDKKYNISTFTILLGKETIFNISRWIVTACYLGMMIAGFLTLNGINPIFLVSTHLGLLALLWWRSLGVNLDDKIAIASFYQFIWKLFFLEYLVFPTACWLV